jgi:hypothetical protein
MAYKSESYSEIKRLLSRKEPDYVRAFEVYLATRCPGQLVYDAFR